MRFFTVLAFLMSLIAGGLFQHQVKISQDRLDSLWNTYKSIFDKSYEGPEEDGARKALFESKVIDICLHNLENDLGQHSYTMGVNQFSDIDTQEIKERYTGLLVE